MMQILAAALLAFALAMLGMAVGVLLGRGRSIVGCAAAAPAADGPGACGTCGCVPAPGATVRPTQPPQRERRRESTK